MKYEHLQVETHADVLLVRLNRPGVANSLSNALRDEMESVLAGAEASATVGALVLSGGKNVFSAGYDLKEVIETRLASFAHRAIEYNTALYTFAKPLVAAVSGFCLAGGFDLALAGDIIIAGEKKTFFGHPEMRFAPPFVLPLARKIGVDKARALILQGGMISAKAALSLGIINQLADNDKLEEIALKTAQKMAKWRPVNVRMVKSVCAALEFGDTRAAIVRELRMVESVLADTSVLGEIEAYYASLN